MTHSLLVCVEDHARLTAWSRSMATRAGLVTRARIVLASGDGHGTSEVSSRVGVAQPTIGDDPRYPQQMTKSLIPWAPKPFILCQRIGRPPISIIGLERRWHSPVIHAPTPPRKSACLCNVLRNTTTTGPSKFVGGIPREPR